MRHYERPLAERQKLISSEKAASFPYKMVYLGFVIGVIGVIAFFLAFFYQNALNRAGFPYREAQLLAISVVFIGWITFLVFCRFLGISTRALTYPRLMSILRNQVEEPVDELRSARKQIAAAFGSLDDKWALYPEIFGDDPRKTVSMVLVGPTGVFGIHANYKDPRKKEFIDPAPILAAGCLEIEKRLKMPVKPVLGFARHTKHYTSPVPEVKVFTFYDALVYITSREQTLTSAEIQTIEMELRYLSNVGRSTLAVGAV